MGNIVGRYMSSTGRRRHRRGNNHSHVHPQHVYAAAYTSTYHNLPPPQTPYFKYQNGARYPPPPPPAVPSPESHNDDDDDHHRTAMNRALEAWVDGGYPPVYVDYQTVTIPNDINIKKETFKIEADEENPGKFLVSFTFDATVPCNITVYFFQKEGNYETTMKEDSLPPLTVSFQEGVGQAFRQKSGTGIDLSTFNDEELRKVDEMSVYPLAVTAEAIQLDGNLHNSDVTDSEMTYAVFEKDEGKYKVRVVKQLLWVEGVKYDVKEIYEFRNSIDGGDDGKDQCVTCLSEPRDTTVLPCRHMCMCNVCAKVLRFQTKIQCPICRQPVERLLEIKVKS